jgi:hypothetical protein
MDCGYVCGGSGRLVWSDLAGEPGRLQCARMKSEQRAGVNARIMLADSREVSKVKVTCFQRVSEAGDLKRSGRLTICAFICGHLQQNKSLPVAAELVILSFIRRIYFALLSSCGSTIYPHAARAVLPTARRAAVVTGHPPTIPEKAPPDYS